MFREHNKIFNSQISFANINTHIGVKVDDRVDVGLRVTSVYFYFTFYKLIFKSKLLISKVNICLFSFFYVAWM